MKKIIVDCRRVLTQSLMLKGLRASQKLSVADSQKEKNLTTINGFLSSILSTAAIYGTSDFIFCWDFPPFLRTKILSSYRLLGERGTAIKIECYIRDKIVPALGFKNSFYKAGYESMDIIASVVNYLHSQKVPRDKIIVKSSDKIFFQLLDKCCIHLSNTKLMTHEMFDLQYPFPIELWPTYMSLIGSPKPPIQGIELMGPNVAKRFLTRTYTKGIAYSNAMSIRGKKIIKRNLSLMTIPLNEVGEFKLEQNKLNPSAMRKIAEHFGFASILKNLDYWEKLVSQKRTSGLPED